MDIQITSRHFKARPTLLESIEGAVEGLTQIYDGINNAQVILEVEPHTEGKLVEITLMVYHDRLFAKETSDDFQKSLNLCIDKLERQLRRFKEKLTAKARGTKEQVNSELLSEDEEY